MLSVSNNLAISYSISNNTYTIIKNTENENENYINITSCFDGYIYFKLECNENIKFQLVGTKFDEDVKTKKKIHFNIKKNEIVKLMCENINVNDVLKINNFDFKYKNIYNLVFISSKIYVSDKPFTYTNTRSIYSASQRLNQTLETIKSVKQHIPNYYIVLLDNSAFDDDQKKMLSENVNLLINPTSNELLNYYTNISENKAFGEIAQTVYLMKYIENIPFDNFFKISGRYTITENFDYNKFDNHYNIFKLNQSVLDYYYTSLYKISRIGFNKYKKIIKYLFEDIQKNKNKYNDISLEIFLPKLLKKKNIDTLGLVENIAVRNEINLI